MIYHTEIPAATTVIFSGHEVEAASVSSLVRNKDLTCSWHPDLECRNSTANPITVDVNLTPTFDEDQCLKDIGTEMDEQSREDLCIHMMFENQGYPSTPDSINDQQNLKVLSGFDGAIIKAMELTGQYYLDDGDDPKLPVELEGHVHWLDDSIVNDKSSVWYAQSTDPVVDLDSKRKTCSMEWIDWPLAIVFFFVSLTLIVKQHLRNQLDKIFWAHQEVMKYGYSTDKSTVDVPTPDLPE